MRNPCATRKRIEASLANEHHWYQHEITRFIRVESVDSDYLHIKTSDDNIREAETLS